MTPHAPEGAPQLTPETPAPWDADRPSDAAVAVRNERDLQLALFLASAIALTALVGWATGSIALTQLGSPRGYTMKVNTALGVLGLAVSIRLHHRGRTFGSRAAAALVLALMLGTLGEYIVGMPFGIDELLVLDPDRDVGAPGRPSAGTAIGLGLLSIASLLARRPGQPPNLALVPLFATLALSLFALVGYVLAPDSLGSFAPFVSLSIPTAASLLLLSSAWVRATRDTFLWHLLADGGLVPTLVRRIVLASIVLPIGLGILAHAGMRASLYDASLSVALQTVITVLGLLAVALVLGRDLDRTTQDRARSLIVLQASERKYRDLFEESPEMLFTVDAGTSAVQTANRAFRERMASLHPGTYDKTVPELLAPSSRAAWAHALATARSAGTVPAVPLELLPGDDGEAVHVELTVHRVPMPNDEGDLLRCTWIDRTEARHQQTHRDFLLSVEAQGGPLEFQTLVLCASLLDHLDATACLWLGQEGDRGVAEVQTGFRRKRLDGPIDLTAFASLEPRRAVVVEPLHLLTPDGQPSFDASSAVVVPHVSLGDVTGCLIVERTPARWMPLEIELIEEMARRLASRAALARTFHDLEALNTDLEASNRSLERALGERDVFLQEIHHRVKNNLTVISGLIRLQQRGVHDPTARQALQECSQRVLAIAAIHEQLYQASDLAAVPFGRYLEQQARSLAQVYGAAGRGVQLRVDAPAPVELSVEQAIPAGLLVQELMTNALKHAFPEGRQGTIRITASREGERYVLAVADDGVGMVSPPPGARSDSLGWTLIHSLARQLGATLEVRGDDGTEVRLTFEPPRPR